MTSCFTRYLILYAATTSVCFLQPSSGRTNPDDLSHSISRNHCKLKHCSCEKTSALLCHGNLEDEELKKIPQNMKIIFQDGVLNCDCKFMEWASTNKVIVKGKCSKPAHLTGLRLEELVNDEFNCGMITRSQGHAHIRKRRSVIEDESTNITKTKPSGPGGRPVWPCDFEETFCQWYHLSDSDFTWERKKGSTATAFTGPDGDHTFGDGTYIYIETSFPRQMNDKARLVSPTLRPVMANQSCSMIFYVYMYGDHIGKLNIYQSPIIGHDILKKVLKTSLGKQWHKYEIMFDSDKEFQVVIEGVRGISYRGDIALDDISFSSGCQRLESGYVQLRPVNLSTFNTGVVNIYNNGTWGQVCREGWTLADANVTCRNLGFDSVRGISGVTTSGSTITGIKSLGCAGKEVSIDQCSRSTWSDTISCTSNQTVSIQCSGISPVCPLKTHMYCPKNTNEITAKCISFSQRCDFAKDCWDGSDEKDCNNYTRCTFEDSSICGWIQAMNDQVNWTRHRGSTPTDRTGPSTDHMGDASKFYIFVNVAGRSAEKAKIGVTPRFQGNHQGLCRIRFFYHMLGWATGSLRVLIAGQYTVRTVWQKDGPQGNQWNRAEVTLLNTSKSFQVIFEAEHTGYFSEGDIAIDDVSFTPECLPAEYDNTTCLPSTFKCFSGECVALESRCDFKVDCFDGTDERDCGFNTPGRCNFERDFCDWRNETDDTFDFERHQFATLSFGTGPSYDHTLGYGQRGFYAFIESSDPRKAGDKARLVGPQFIWTNIQGCRIRFFYHMWSIYPLNNMGTLKAILQNPITLENILLWQKHGNQGNKWNLADVSLATNWSVAQVVIEAVRGNTYRSDIAIDDISFTHQCYPSTPSHVDKNYDVRLVGSRSSFQGRVEVFRVGYWGTVCRDKWDQNDAQVVCRQLGYSRAENAFPSFGPGKGPIWLDDMKCFGNESNLNICSHNGWSNHNCDHSKDATAVCDIFGGTTVPVRLVGPINNTRGGKVEVFYSNKWGSICFDAWDLHDAHVVCRQVGFFGVEKITREDAAITSLAWLSNIKCTGNENSLDKCEHSGWGAVSTCNNGFAGVICKRSASSEGDIRLVGGRSKKEGRLEIFHRGEWGTVCEDQWSNEDAKVVCLQLGFTSVVKSHQSFGPGTGRVWLYNVLCYGNETSLSTCAHGWWGNSPCSHDEDVGVICGDHAYIGCFKDGYPRVLPHKTSMNVLSPAMCLRYCQSKGYSYIGLEWSTECYCGNHYDKYGNASERECSSPCAGDPSKICGGPWRLSVYATNPAILPSSAPGHIPVRQSCSFVTYIGSFVFLTPTSMSNYFSGDHKSGIIWSPFYPTKYPNKIHCVWVLNLMPGSKARVEFLDFNTEKDFDYVEIRDGKRKYDQELTPRFGFSGNTTKILTASSSTMWIKFFADETINAKGFKLRYTSLGLPMATTPNTTLATTTIAPSSLPIIQSVIGGCNGILDPVNVTFGYHDYHHSSGFIRSPGHPQHYTNNLQCHWSITVQHGFTIYASVTKLDLNSSSDLLVIDDAHRSERSSNRTLPWVFHSSDRFLRVYFSTDASGQAKGFMLKYKRDDYGSIDKTGKEKSDKGMSAGIIAGIVVGFLVLLIILALVVLLLKNKKKRNNTPAIHSFHNQAYDSTDGMVMATIPSHSMQDPFYATAVAPPPYSLEAEACDQIPGYAAVTPTAPETGYANLYSCPPPYQQSNADPKSTTTAIGSVTSLRSATNADGQKAGVALPPIDILPRAGISPPSIEGEASFGRSVLPPITVSTQQTKASLPEGQAGPLPEKPLSDINQSPGRPEHLEPLDMSVSRCPSRAHFDVEVPFEFICPISNEIMKHPVSASDGYSYEHQAIKSWLRRRQTSPMTNEPITDLSLRANEHLEARIKEFVQGHSIP